MFTAASVSQRRASVVTHELQRSKRTRKSPSSSLESTPSEVRKLLYSAEKNEALETGVSQDSPSSLEPVKEDGLLRNSFFDESDEDELDALDEDEDEDEDEDDDEDGRSDSKVTVGKIFEPTYVFKHRWQY